MKKSAFKVRIVVLNYNGARILPECLPSLVEAARKASSPTKLTILDNRSTDPSLEWVKARYPEIEIVTAPKNLLLVSNNDYLKQIDDDLVILLNNDIRVAPDFVDPLVQVFEKNPDAFLATPQTFSFDGARYEGGRTRARIRWGLFWSSGIFPGYVSLRDKPGYTFASGFGAFNRKRFVALGGYDDLYLPGIMEDADLGFRAWREGFRSYYVPQSKAFHLGQASFKKAFGEKGIRILAHRNSFLFVWKNISDASLWLEHLLLLPFRLLYALVTGKFELVAGFFQALSRLPQALNRRSLPPKRARTDRQIFNLASDLPVRRDYLFKKKWKRTAIRIFDLLGNCLTLFGLTRKKFSPEKIRNILVFRVDSLGDGVLTLPAIKFLQERFPKAEIDFVVSPAVQEFYGQYFPLAKLYRMPEVTLKNCFQLAETLKKHPYDLGIDFRGDQRIILTMFLARIPHRWGREGTGGGFLLTQRLAHPFTRHEVLENLALVGKNGFAATAEFPSHSESSRESETAEKWLRASAGQKKIVIHIGAGYPSKRWSIARFVEVASEIRKRGLGTPIFIGTKEEARLLEPYRQKFDSSWLDLVGKTSLPELLSVLRHADLFIGNDSGPAHLAALLNRKLVVIFSGTNDYRQWAPWSSKLRIVNHPVPCSPCEEKICPLRKQICLEDVSVEEVLQETEALLHE